MRWLLHGKFDPTVADALRAHGHLAQTLAEAGVAEDAGGAVVLAAAHKAQLDLLTGDADTAARPFVERMPFGRCIALLSDDCEKGGQGGQGGQGVAIERFFARYPRPVPGRLYTITPSRIKVRQLPARK